MNATRYVRPVFREAWARITEESLNERDGIPAVVKHHPALENWSTLRGAPSGRASDELRYALKIAISAYDHQLVGVCLQRTLEIVSAGEQDPRWDTWWAASGKVERGKLLVTGELAHAWLNDADLNSDNLAYAGRDTSEGALQRPIWSELAQSEYLHGIQALVVSGALESANELLRGARKFTSVQSHYDWNSRLVGLLLEHSSESTLQDHFDPYFDQVRDPTISTQSAIHKQDRQLGIPLLRLRLALIRWIYIERQPVAGNWRHIIGQIGY